MVDAREYHERTNHSPERVRRDSFRLDFENKPRPWKEYETLSRRDIAGEPDPPETPALEAIATSTWEPDGTPTLRGRDLHTLCHYATGITKELEIQGRQMRFRAAACTGKLYHVDLYLITGDLDGLAAGVYHFDPASGAFDVLRTGEYRGVLARATGGHEAVNDAPVTVVATSQWWRNAWKYRARTYRHAFWDSGTILANLLAVAQGGGHRAGVVTGFADQPVVDLLGLDPDEEAPLALVPVGAGDPVRDPPAVESIDPAEASLSPEVVDYPLVPDAWRQSTLADGDAATAWRERFDAFGGAEPGNGHRIALEPVDRGTASSRPVGATIERRGSLREYAHEPISDRLFATVLDRALRGVPTDCPGATGLDTDRLVAYYCLVHAVEGIPSGTYRYHPGPGVLERVGETDRRTAGHLALDQPVVGDAAANVYVMADIETIVDAVGNRGYRLAQLVGGITLGRLYLATYAHRAIGGRGFTFYDELVSEHLTPAAADRTPMTLFAFGQPGG